MSKGAFVVCGVSLAHRKTDPLPKHVGSSRPSVFQDDLRDGLLRSVRKREGDMHCAEFLRKLGGVAVEKDGRAASGLASHLDIPPTHAAIPAGAESLHGSLFGREAGGIALGAIGFRFAVTNLARSENAGKKAAAKTLHGRRNART